MKPGKKKVGHGGARKGAGRKKRAGWKQGSVTMPDSAWERLSRLAAKRRARGGKNGSGRSIAGGMGATEIVYFGPQPAKRREPGGVRRERGVSFGEVSSE